VNMLPCMTCGQTTKAFAVLVALCVLDDMRVA
jgi:hypothetical protein